MTSDRYDVVVLGVGGVARELVRRHARDPATTGVTPFDLGLFDPARFG